MNFGTKEPRINKLIKLTKYPSTTIGRNLEKEQPGKK